MTETTITRRNPAAHARTIQSMDWTSWLPILVLGLGSVVCGDRVWRPTETARALRNSAYALSCEDYARAERSARLAISLNPESDLAWALAGAAAAKLKRSGEAIECYTHVRDGAPVDVRIAAAEGLADRQILIGHAAEAEQNLRKVLELDPEHVWANWRLAYLLQVEGRCWESLPYLRHALAHRSLGADELVLLGTPERVFIRDEHFVEVCQAARPGDPLPLLGESRHALLRANREQARTILERIAKARPDSLEAQARWGRLQLELEGSDGLPAWEAQLPATADLHPEIWVTRGYWMKHLGRDRDALASFAAALRLFPDHVGATYQLSQLLSALGESGAAERFATRSSQLSKLEYVIDELRRTPDFDRLREAFHLLTDLGRISEALGWCRVMLMYHPESDWATTGIRDHRNRLSVASPDPLHGIAENLLSRPVFPRRSARDPLESAPSAAVASSPIRFRDDAAKAGLSFQYVNGTTRSSGLEHMLQATGAGCGVLDYDGDSWPDLYFCQSGIWPVNPAQNPHQDQLFRNRGNGLFADVTSPSGLGDADFSQGLAVGDYDNDGFADLFIGNVGPNRLYHNNGDGTFTEVTRAAQIDRETRWTTSAACADFNGDGLSDLYVVHYLQLADVLNHACKFNGRPMGCAPTMFTAEQDQLYINQGDGRFVNETESAGIIARDGKGLGIVVADFQNRGALDIFVGNDTTANFLFVNSRARPGAAASFHEEGLLRGLALNEDGLAQACMGIASGDANSDGQLDLYVTNYYADYNTLYLQQSDQTFADMTRHAALREPTFNLLGFGTQFVDGDLDGWLDLVVANGHVDRTFSTGVPDAMPPQFFRNRNGRQFVEVAAGSYFEQKLLGRSMSRVDWNRDGRDDVCVVHLDAPAALLTNDSSETGHWAALRLHGTTSARDAVGARVLLSAGGRTRMAQVTAGDGYMCANERRLVFGLGQATRIDRLEIVWPSGRRDVFTDPPIEVDLVAVEGARRLVELSR